MAGFDGNLALLSRVGPRICAWPAAQVREVMRRLPTERAPSAPPFVCGLSIVRGGPVPVIDVALLLGEAASDLGYFVTVSCGDRVAALAVDGVMGVRRLPPAALHALPPLLDGADHAFVSQIGALDDQLLFVLDSARIVSDDVWTACSSEQVAT
ncbi:chemotaxis protein CheW [Phenylobacterium sp. LjRoot225]|uniref:chemotaxis protein CheW n=1 Tax=Phenylobacterium sp. LjRoot225 TaxID=3342285 RepID=UPI003ECDA4A9